MKLKIQISQQQASLFCEILDWWKADISAPLAIWVLDELFSDIKISEKGAAKITLVQAMAFAQFFKRLGPSDIELLVFLAENQQQIDNFIFQNRNKVRNGQQQRIQP